MQIVAAEILAEIAALAVAPIPRQEYEASATALAGDKELAKRITEWLPEAFGLVLASHVEPSIILPATFLVRDSLGKWSEFPLTADPVFQDCVTLAIALAHDGPREVFSGLALASSVHAAINQALNQGASLSGAVLQPIRMHGLTAESYCGV